MTELMPSLTQSYAEKFAANWKAQNPVNEEDETTSLDDSLTNLQWLHNINIQDITATSNSTLSDASGSNDGSNCSDSECHSESGDSKSSDLVLKEPSIDYRNDPHHKPPYSYATLICMAMRDTKKVKITLSAIYKWIKENFMYYRMADPTWQNSIRHNLSLNKCFVKVARKKDEPGKGGFWKIDPAYADMFVDGVFKRRRGVNTQKNSKKNAKKSGKKTLENLDRKRFATRQNDEPKTKRQKFNSLRVTDPSDLFDDCDFSEEEIPPFSGGLKGKFSWTSILTNEDELDESIRELADAHGISLDSPSHPIGGLSSPALSPPPSTGSHEEHFKADPDLDLTIQGIAIHPPRDHLNTPSPTALTDATQSLFKYMPPSPPALYDDGHPWADTCFDITDENNNILDNVW